MPLTPEELYEHAERMRDLIASRQHRIEADMSMGPASRAHLLIQLNALQDRVDEIIRTLGAPQSSGPAPGLVLPGVSPRVDPLSEVLRQTEIPGNLPAASGDFLA